LLYILGAIVFTFIFRTTLPYHYTLLEKSFSDTLMRIKKPSSKLFRKGVLDLLDEYRMALALLIGLNILLGVFNFIDITTVWYNYEWQGEMLRSFVHRGIYVLIIAVLCSIFIILYYFRNNLNFFSKSKWLRISAYIWLAQNIILLISVAIRNSIYIEYFNLAYKRIGVYFFLFLCLLGIISVIWKLATYKSKYWLQRINAMSVFIVLHVITFFDWDKIIASHNYKNFDHAFFHYDFMQSLAPSAWSEMPIDDNTIRSLELMQSEAMLPVRERHTYMSATTYQQIINQKQEKFCNEYSTRHCLEWNYADSKTYQNLQQKFSISP